MTPAIPNNTIGDMLDMFDMICVAVEWDGKSATTDSIRNRGPNRPDGQTLTDRFDPNSDSCEIELSP